MYSFETVQKSDDCMRSRAGIRKSKPQLPLRESLDSGLLPHLSRYRIVMLRSLQRYGRTIPTMTRTPLRNPLIAVIGATGTGKSQVLHQHPAHHTPMLIATDSSQSSSQSATMARSSTAMRCNSMRVCRSSRTRSPTRSGKAYHTTSWDA